MENSKKQEIKPGNGGRPSYTFIKDELDGITLDDFKDAIPSLNKIKIKTPIITGTKSHNDGQRL